MTSTTQKQEVEDDGKDAGVNGPNESSEGNNDDDGRKDGEPPDEAAVALKDEPVVSGEVLRVPPPPPVRAVPTAAVTSSQTQLAIAPPTKRSTKVIHILLPLFSFRKKLRVNGKFLLVKKFELKEQ